MEKLIDIVKGTTANLSYVCEGKVYYCIDTNNHSYQLEVDSCDDDWKATYLMPRFKAIHLMRWIRKGIEEDNGRFVMLR